MYMLETQPFVVKYEIRHGIHLRMIYVCNNYLSIRTDGYREMTYGKTKNVLSPPTSSYDSPLLPCSHTHPPTQKNKKNKNQNQNPNLSIPTALTTPNPDQLSPPPLAQKRTPSQSDNENPSTKLPIVHPTFLVSILPSFHSCNVFDRL